LIPRPFSAVPVAAPWERAVDVRPSAPICGGDSVGGAHLIRLIEPPSWSTAISSGSWPPAFASSCRRFVSALSAVAVVMLRPNRMTPPTSPRRIRPSSPPLGVVPSIATISFCPTSWLSVGVGAREKVGVGRGVAAAGATVLGIADGRSSA
jgi:hypothetical protein